MAIKINKQKKPDELLFLGGLFGGLGVGMIYGQVAAGLFIGMGAGVIAAFIYTVVVKNKK